MVQPQLCGSLHTDQESAQAKNHKGFGDIMQPVKWRAAEAFEKAFNVLRLIEQSALSAHYT